MAVATRSRRSGKMSNKSRTRAGERARSGDIRPGGNTPREASARSRTAGAGRPNASKFSMPGGGKLPLRVPDDLDKLIDNTVQAWNGIADKMPGIPHANRSQVALGAMTRGLENVGDFIKELGGDVAAAKKVADTRASKQMKDEARHAKKANG